jgi:hypothetical protein
MKASFSFGQNHALQRLFSRLIVHFFLNYLTFYTFLSFPYFIYTNLFSVILNSRAGKQSDKNDTRKRGGCGRKWRVEEHQKGKLTLTRLYSDEGDTMNKQLGWGLNRHLLCRNDEVAAVE